MSYPGKAQEVFDGKYTPTEGFDSDDYSSFTTNVLEKSLVMNPLGVAAPTFFTVTWLNGMKPGGHNVCLVRLPDLRFAFMDYGMPAGHASDPAGVARNIVDTYASKEAHILVWAIAKYNLTPVEIHWG